MGKKILTFFIGKRISWAMVEYPVNTRSMTVLKGTEFPMTPIKALLGGKKNLPFMQGLDFSQTAWTDMKMIDPFTGKYEREVRIIFKDPQWNDGSYMLNEMPEEQSLAIREMLIYKREAEQYRMLLDEMDEALHSGYGDAAVDKALQLVRDAKKIRKETFTYSGNSFGGGNQ